MAYKRKKGKSIVGGRGKKKTYPYKGIDYKSTLERNMAMLLDEAGIEFKYEPTKFDVVPAFQFGVDSYERQSNGKGDMINRGQKKVQSVSYTPDFVGEGFIIETKGYANETFPLRWKLFKKMIVDNPEQFPNVTLYKPQKISECEQVVKLIKEKHGQKASS
jgi:hypothetical protein